MFKGAKAKASTAVNELATAQQASIQEVGNTATEARLRNDTLQQLARFNHNIQALDNEITNTSPYFMPLKKKDFERRIASLRAELEDIQNGFRSETERINNEAAIDQSRKSISSLLRRVAAGNNTLVMSHELRLHGLKEVILKSPAPQYLTLNL
ncbi:hypothetical protein Hypma_002166 [Hypsizygus marmoreus]|uniref:Uncharacterized protein n=1 Tax=Hypsizygus marmoreus TaxID=39966 RepID=A0A369K016_HYPMA|nr:hypothetical protein Hypma_002166 [Hypsizygus marmoreus]